MLSPKTCKIKQCYFEDIYTHLCQNYNQSQLQVPEGAGTRAMWDKELQDTSEAVQRWFSSCESSEDVFRFLNPHGYPDTSCVEGFYLLFNCILTSKLKSYLIY